MLNFSFIKILATRSIELLRFEPEVRPEDLLGRKFTLTGSRKLTFTIPKDAHWVQPIVENDELKCRAIVALETIITQHARVFVRKAKDTSEVSIYTVISDVPSDNRIVNVSFTYTDAWRPISNINLRFISEQQLPRELIALRSEWDDDRDYVFRITGDDRCKNLDCVWIGIARKELLKRLDDVARVFGIRLLTHVYVPQLGRKQVQQLKGKLQGRDLRGVFLWQQNIPDLSTEVNSVFSPHSVITCEDTHDDEMLNFFFRLCEEINNKCEEEVEDASRMALASGTSDSYLAVICQGLFRRRKIGPHNHFEVEQTLWKVEPAGGDKNYARDVLLANASKYEASKNSDSLILYKDGRADGKCVYFLNSRQIGEVRQLCQRFDLKLV
jgi:hypothetical protein